MNHQGTKLFETERFILRKATLEDVPYMYNNYCKDPEVSRYLTWLPHTDIKVTEAFVNGFLLKNYDRLDFYEWVIESKEIHQAIGMISVVKIDENIEEVHIGYCLSQSLWGNGIMPEVFKRIIQFLFEEVNVNRIVAQHDTANPKSGKVMLKCGLQLEGILKQGGKTSRDVFCDLAQYALLKSDYKNG